MNIEGVLNVGGLRNWWARLANRENYEAGVVVVGDSISESFGVSTYSSRLTVLLQNALRAAHPTAGATGLAQGYVPARTIFAPGPSVSTTGSPTASVSHGLGMKCYSVTSAGTVQWASAYASRVAVWYATATTLAGNGIVAVDGVDKATLTGLAGAYVAATRWLSDDLGAGNHTVTVRGSGGFGFQILAAQFFDGDHDRGVHVYDSSHYGWSSDSFVTGVSERNFMALAAVKPGVVVVNLGTNDWSYRTPAAFLANVDTMLGWIATYMGSTAYSVLLVGPWRPVRNFATVDSEWVAMLDGLKARAVGNIAYLGLQPPWPTLLANVASPYMQETDYPLHPNDTGTAAYAGLLAQALALPTPPGPSGTYLPATPKAVLP